MNGAATKSIARPCLQAGRPLRFWTLVAVLFFGQAGLIWLFAERTHKPPAVVASDFTTVLLPTPVPQDRLATALFAEDPTLFLEPSRRGFSGKAWMDTAALDYPVTDDPAPSVWLAMNASSWRPQWEIPGASSPAELSLASPTATEFAPASILLAPDPGAAPSRVSFDGALAQRRLASARPILGPQPSAQLLSNTVVQVAVDPAGLVLSACVTGNSGMPSADAAALAIAKALRFEAQAGAAWGNAVFAWQTVEPGAAAVH